MTRRQALGSRDGVFQTPVTDDSPATDARQALSTVPIDGSANAKPQARPSWSQRVSTIVQRAPLSAAQLTAASMAPRVPSALVAALAQAVVERRTTRSRVTSRPRCTFRSIIADPSAWHSTVGGDADDGPTFVMLNGGRGSER